MAFDGDKKDAGGSKDDPPVNTGPVHPSETGTGPGTNAGSPEGEHVTQEEKIERSAERDEEPEAHYE
jgi:hypothetical protein